VGWGWKNDRGGEEEIQPEVRQTMARRDSCRSIKEQAATGEKRKKSGGYIGEEYEKPVCPFRRKMKKGQGKGEGWSRRNYWWEGYFSGKRGSFLEVRNMKMERDKEMREKEKESIIGEVVRRLIRVKIREHQYLRREKTTTPKAQD